MAEICNNKNNSQLNNKTTTTPYDGNSSLMATIPPLIQATSLPNPTTLKEGMSKPPSRKIPPKLIKVVDDPLNESSEVFPSVASTLDIFKPIFTVSKALENFPIPKLVQATPITLLSNNSAAATIPKLIQFTPTAPLFVTPPISKPVEATPTKPLTMVPVPKPVQTTFIASSSSKLSMGTVPKPVQTTTIISSSSKPSTSTIPKPVQTTPIISSSNKLSTGIIPKPIQATPIISSSNNSTSTVSKPVQATSSKSSLGTITKPMQATAIISSSNKLSTGTVPKPVQTTPITSSSSNSITSTAPNPVQTTPITATNKELLKTTPVIISPLSDKEPSQDALSNSNNKCRRRGRGCGKCEGCTRDDCKTCSYCLDKPKYGGPGKRKQRCALRICSQFQAAPGVKNTIHTPFKAASVMNSSAKDQTNTTEIMSTTSSSRTADQQPKQSTSSVMSADSTAKPSESCTIKSGGDHATQSKPLASQSSSLENKKTATPKQPHSIRGKVPEVDQKSHKSEVALPKIPASLFIQPESPFVLLKLPNDHAQPESDNSLPQPKVAKIEPRIEAKPLESTTDVHTPTGTNENSKPSSSKQTSNKNMMRCLLCHKERKLNLAKSSKFCRLRCLEMWSELHPNEDPNKAEPMNVSSIPSTTSKPRVKRVLKNLQIDMALPGSAVYKSADSTTPTDINSYSMTLRGGKRTAQDPPAIPSKKIKESTASTPVHSAKTVTTITTTNTAGPSSTTKGNDLSTDVSQWSVSDVVQYFESTPDCQHIAPLLEEQEVDGMALLLLSHHSLTNCLGIKLGPALKVMTHIEKLKQQVSYSHNSII